MTASAARSVPPPTDLEEAMARIRADGGRITDAKRAVAELLFESDRALNVDEITTAVHGIERSVLYRCLAQFEVLGIVEHIHLGHGAAVYRRRGLPTVPVACMVCGSAWEIGANETQSLRDTVLERTGVTLDLIHFPLTGRCESCQEAS